MRVNAKISDRVAVGHGPSGPSVQVDLRPSEQPAVSGLPAVVWALAGLAVLIVLVDWLFVDFLPGGWGRHLLLAFGGLSCLAWLLARAGVQHHGGIGRQILVGVFVLALVHGAGWLLASRSHWSIWLSGPVVLLAGLALGVTHGRRGQSGHSDGGRDCASFVEKRQDSARADQRQQ